MKHPCFFAFALLSLATFANAADSSKPGTWVDPETALAEHPAFAIQGEYLGEKDGAKLGVQASAMDGDKFLVSSYQGGLPGADWDRSPVTSQVLEGKAFSAYIEGLTKIERESPTMGKAAPEGAAVYFNGEANDTIKGEVKDGYIWAGSQTTVPVGDFTMHVEFRLPYKPATKPSSQDRGNSGVYIYNNYECQVLDSFALNLVEDANPFSTQSRNKQWCGSFYKFKIPDTPMAFPPLRWQTYDIDFTAPRFSDGKKVANARITVRQNGVVIHDDVELPKGTGAGGGRPEKEKGLIYFQGHGNPVAFRNIWIVEK
tara:strand:+ start:3913 stop:4854 length:942 start_codon:yes stop_codon:yes gene_type:complete